MKKLIVLSLCILTSMSFSEEFIPATISVPYESGNQVINFPISWVSSEANSVVLIVAIHGTPGSWDAWEGLLQRPIAKEIEIVALDRPGWGGSVSNEVAVIPSFKGQSSLITAWLKSFVGEEQRPIVLLSHSWGGPVAIQLALDNPDLISGIVSVAGPFNSELSKPRWYNKLAKTFVVKFLIGNGMRKSNIEMLSLSDELDAMSVRLSELQLPMIIVQGEKDFLVNYNNAAYIKNNAVNAAVMLRQYPERGHFIPFKQPDLVDSALKEMLQVIDNN